MIGTVTSDIFVALIVLGLIIVIHEFGHFAVAKLFKIKVETFSVGFGPRLIGFRRGETDYRISALPLGGYVKMSGENPGDNITGDPREFLSKPKWQRFLVAAAGPAMNIILAFALLVGLLMYGTQIPEYLNNQAVVGIVMPDSPAAQAGVRINDRIVAMDGKNDPDWQDISLIIGTNPSRPLSLTLERGGQKIETTLTPKVDERQGTGEAGMGPLIRTVVKDIRQGSPAEAAGMQPNDEIVAINGIDLRTSGKTIQETIQSIPLDTFPITVLRNGNAVDVTVTPIVEKGQRIIGIGIPIPTVLVKLGFADAVSRSAQMNADNAKLIFQVLGRLLKREASVKQLDGPIGIVRASGQAADLGLAALVMLTAAISLNLGIVNLLPIPILDGGVMLLLLIEFVMGRDLSLRIKERIVQVSMVFLLLMMVVVLYNDVLKLMPPATGTP
jgi:regulator of sigma E protease